MTGLRASIGGRLIAAGLATLSALASRSSMDAVLSLGGGLGRAWHRIGGWRTRRVRQQLARAFPEHDAEWVRRCSEGVFVHLGLGLAELVLLRSGHRAALLDRVCIEGLEHLEAARRASATGGVLVVTAHLGNWELAAARVASLGLPISVVYRGLRSPALDEALKGLRVGAVTGSGSAAPAPDPDFEQLAMGRAGFGVIRALRRGRLVLVLLDQNARRSEGVFVPFFGRPASTRVGPARIARALDVPVVPASIVRAPDGRRHRIRIEPALSLAAASSGGSERSLASQGAAESGDEPERLALQRDVAEMTAVLERWIRESPDQWIWTHGRWRTRPRESDYPLGSPAGHSTV